MISHVLGISRDLAIRQKAATLSFGICNMLGFFPGTAK
ncbi:hypothetical protein V6Z11_A07G069500 [Gossypium hirsutum]